MSILNKNRGSFSTVKEYLCWAEKHMQNANLYFGHGTSDAWNEACAILIYVLQLPINCSLTKYSGLKLTNKQQKTLQKVTVDRIKTKKPLPYIFNYCYYMGYKFKVTADVLVPRSPFAEIIKNKFKPWSRTHKNILELGTGCGALSILCAKYMSSCIIHAVEISRSALKIAQENIRQHRVEDRVKLFHSDWFCNVPARKYDIIFANPPYVSAKEYKGLPKEYKCEPKLALCALHNGLAAVDTILKQAIYFLKPKGVLFIEVGGTQQTFMHKYQYLPMFWVDVNNGEDGIFGIYQHDLIEYSKQYG